MQLKGKIALVTGAGRSIGKAIAIRLAEEGAAVAVNSYQAANADATVEKIIASGGKAFAVPGDVGKEDEVKKMFAAVIQEYGTLDILVNNAGISPKKENGIKRYVIEMTGDEWRRVVDVNLNGMFYCSKEALKIMSPRKTGAIVNMTSLVANTYAVITGAHYMATKAGAIGLTKALAGEAALDGIRVNAIAPGRIKTEMVAGADDKLNEGFLNTIPMATFGEAVDIANGVLFLVSNQSAYISGAVLAIDGGGVKIG